MRGREIESDDPLVREAVSALTDRRPRTAYAVVRRHRGPGAELVKAAVLILDGRLRRAERRLARIDPDRTNEALVASLHLLRGRDGEARRVLDGYPHVCVAGLGADVLTRVAHRRGMDVRELLGEIANPEVFQFAGTALFLEGAFAEAAEWFSRGDEDLHAYNAACGLARSGEAERALGWLGTALDRGFDDAEALDTDEDLASLRARPGWAAVRARLGPAPVRPTPRHVLDHDLAARRMRTALCGGWTESAYDLAKRYRGRTPALVGAAASFLLGKPRRAARWVCRVPPDQRDRGVVAAFFWASGRRGEALSALSAGDLAPMEPVGAYTLAVVLLASGDPVSEVFRHVRDDEVLAAVASALAGDDRWAEAAAWWERTSSGARHAMDAAGAWAAAGDADGGLRCVGLAIDRGWTDAEVLDLAEDLAPLRAHPGWAAVRGRLGAVADRG